MTNTYVTLDDFAQIVKYDIEKYGVQMQFMLDSAVRHIEDITHRKWKADTTATARLFTGSNGQIIDVDPFVQLTAIGFKYNFDDATYTPMTVSDYIAFSGTNGNPDFNTTPYTKLMINPNGGFTYWPYVSTSGDSFWSNSERSIMPSYPNIQITARWGESDTVIETIRNCVIIQATRWMKRAEGAYGDALGNTDTGQMMFVRKMDNDMRSMLHDGGLIKIGIGRRRIR